MGAERGGLWLYLAVLMAAAAGFAMLNLPVGLSEDTDTYLLLSGAADYAARGLSPNRSFGFPLYELGVYPLISAFGPNAAKLYSLGFMLMSVALFFGLLLEIAPQPSRAFWGAMALAAHPLVIISGNTVLETSQSLFFCIAGLYAFCRLARGPSQAWLLPLAFLLGAAVATRPDNLCLAAAAGLALLFRRRPPWGLSLAALALFAAVALGPHLLYSQASYPALGQVGGIGDSLFRKALRAVLGVLALLGPAASLLLAGLLLARFFKGGRALAASLINDSLNLFLLLAAVFYLARYLMLPDELEYILPLLPLVLAALAAGGLKRGWLIALALTLALPNAATLYLFSRNTTGGLAWQPGLSPGVVVQERQARRRNAYLYGEFQELARRAAAARGCHGVSLSIFKAKPGDCVVVAGQSLRYYSAGRLGGRYHRAGREHRVIVYPMVDHRGWRQFIRFQPFRKVRPDQFKEVDPYKLGA